MFTLLPLLTGEERAHHGLLSPRRFTVETAGEAYRAITEGAAGGKLAIEIQDEAEP